MPPQTQALIETHRLRLLLKPYEVLKVDASEAQISVHFGPNPPINPVKVIELIQKDRNTRMAGPDRLVRKIGVPGLKQRVAAVRELLKAVT